MNKVSIIMYSSDLRLSTIVNVKLSKKFLEKRKHEKGIVLMVHVIYTLSDVCFLYHYNLIFNISSEEDIAKKITRT